MVQRIFFLQIYSAVVKKSSSYVLSVVLNQNFSCSLSVLIGALNKMEKLFLVLSRFLKYCLKILDSMDSADCLEPSGIFFVPETYNLIIYFYLLSLRFLKQLFRNQSIIMVSVDLGELIEYNICQRSCNQNDQK